MKKNLMIVLVVLVCLAVVGGLVAFIGKSKAPSSSVQPTPTPQQTTPLSAEELPIISLIPRADKHELTLNVRGFKDIDSIEYELTYLSYGLSRGVVGTVNLSGENEISRKILLGTCSRNVCKYDDDISDGKLTLRLRGPQGLTKITADFDLNSKDHQLTLEGSLVK